MLEYVVRHYYEISFLLVLDCYLIRRIKFSAARSDTSYTGVYMAPVRLWTSDPPDLPPRGKSCNLWGESHSSE